MRWVCLVCGYVHEGAEPPQICPVCKAPKSRFALVEEAQTPQNGPKRWRCQVCGYIHEGDQPPDVCPVCKVGPERFSLLTDDDKAPGVQKKAETPAPKTPAKKAHPRFVCTVCGYVHEGDEPPAFCPVCKLPSDRFVKMDASGLIWAQEGRLGVAKWGDLGLQNGLRSLFSSESAKGAVFTAMARQAERTGQPEAALTLYRLAQERTEGAARLVEMTGDLVSEGLKTNLIKQLQALHAAHLAKLRLASLITEPRLKGLQAALVAMAEDDARQGRALSGLLEKLPE